MPPPGDLPLARALAARWLVDTCSITRPGAITITDAGGTTATGESIEADVPCRLVRTGTRAAIELFGEQAASAADWMLSVERGTALAVGWIVTVAGADYAVTDVADDQTGAADAHALLRRSTPIGGTQP